MENLEEIINSFKDKKILIIGDAMLDLYTFGDVLRISPEAPVPILRKTGGKFVPGGAANVANNIVSLGAHAVFCGVVGSDYFGGVLKQLLEEKGIRVDLVLPLANKPTTVKHRFVSDNQQLLRMDEEDTTPLTEEKDKIILKGLEREIKKCDAIILSDYNKGMFSRGLTQQIIRLAKKNKKKVVADIRPVNKACFEGVDLLTPNLKEAREMSGLSEVKEVGQELVRYFKTDVIITKGEEGISVVTKEGVISDYPTKKIKVFDVSGAGDTVISVVTLSLVSGLGLKEAAYLANCAGGIVVQKPGTATISVEELKSALGEGNHVESVSIVPKVWGYEKWLENNEKYCSKILALKEGYQCSLHYHKIKDEMFLVTKGHVRLEVGDKILHMREGNFVRITPGTLHRFRGLDDSEILEVSTHHMEEDSYRIKGEESRQVDIN